MEYYLKYMAPEDLDWVYPLMEADFVPEERKKQDHILRQMESGMEVGWILMKESKAAGYAFILRNPALPFVLLDYLATMDRGKGDGSVLLALLKNEYPQGILAEVEDPDEGPEPERELRRRRAGFYQRAGFVPQPFENEIFTVRYLVHLWSEAPPEDSPRVCAHTLDALYALQLPYELYEKWVKIKYPD